MFHAISRHGRRRLFAGLVAIAVAVGAFVAVSASGSAGAQAVGGAHYLGEEVRQQIEQAADDVTAIVLPDCGHNPSLEAPQRLAAAYLDFFSTPGVKHL
jgi:hypothetical protein